MLVVSLSQYILVIYKFILFYECCIIDDLLIINKCYTRQIFLSVYFYAKTYCRTA